LDVAFGGMPATPPPLPANARRPWRLFWDLNEGRQIEHDLVPQNTDNKFAWRMQTRINRLSHVEIAAWIGINSLALQPWEMAAISLLDEAYVNAFNAASAPGRMRVSPRKFSPQLFDALFGD
jgi:hypothetical protein